MSYRTDFINCVGENNILSTTCYATAGIAGESDNCSFNGVHTSGSVNGSHILGGLAGRDRDSTFKNCWNETNIDNVNRSIHQCGGIAGMASNSNFYNCANLGYLHGGSRVGGIVGEAKAVTIKNCYGLSNIENYASEWNYDWETETGRNVYNIGTLAGTGASVSLSYAEDGFERNDNGETGVVPHFTGKGKLTESGTDDDLLNALNENLYEMDGEEGLNEWSRTNDGYPLPNGGSFVNTATYYNIWLDGVRVSERNQNDILKNGLASYDDGTNTLYLHDGLVVTNPYNNSLLYTEGDINLCVDGSVEFRSAQNVGGGPSVIKLGEAGGGGRLKIYAPTDKSAAVTVTGAYSEYGINVNALTLDGDVCLTVRTNEPCFAFAYTFTLLSSEAVLDAENLSGNPSMLNFVYSVNLPSTNPQKLYEGTGIDLTCVEQFTKERETESGTTEPYMYPHIRIAPEVYELIDTLPKSLTVSMTQANTEAALSTWAAGQIRTGDITTGNSEITVSDVVSAVAGSDTNQSGTDGSFTVTVKLTKNGISKTTTIPGTITATAYVPPHTHCICGGNTDVGDHTSHTDVIYQPWDGTSAIDYGDDNTAYVYLTDNVTIQESLEIGEGKTLYLCLNGKTFASNGTNKIVVKENSRLILCDCAGGGTIDGADSGWGGTGIYLYNSTMDMYGGKITGGYASGKGGGGAIALDDVNCVFNMYGGEISGNKANRFGGAIFLNSSTSKKIKGGTVNLYGGTISNNSAQIGGAIYSQYGGTVNLYGGKISGNTATANGGGAICLNHSGVLSMTGGKMQNNTAKTDGGAVNLFASTFTFSGGTISNNYSAEYGGAVYLSISGKLNMTGGEICNNTAKEEGGAVHVYGENATFNFSGGTITGNEAKKDGGAVYLNQENSTLNMTGGEISGNKAARNGGAVYMFRATSTLNLSGGTIKNNTAGSSGGAVYFNTTSDGKIQGILNISGNPVVKDNTVSGKANNIAMKTGKTLSIVGAMTDGASVGITTESTNYPVVFSDAYDTNYAGYFFADDENAHVNYNSEKKLELAAGAPHTHSWATEWNKNETHHWHECTADGCDVTNDTDKDDYGAHVYDNDTDTTCNTCGYERTITPSHTHSWAEDWSKNETHHWHECTADGCDVTNVADKDDYGAHVYDNDADTDCNTCGYIRTVEPPAHTHSWATAWSNDETYHWHNCTAEGCDVTENSGKYGYGAHVYDNDTDTTCNTCEYIRTITPSHTHSWAEDWSRSETHHWHECTAEGCGVTENSDKDGYGAHVYDDDADTTCNTCGYIRTSEPPAHTHSWAKDWTTDGTHHWHNCTADGCDVTNVADKDGYGEHDYDDASDTDCNTCGYIRTVEPPVHTHSWATEWNKNETHHWHECTAEGCNVTEISGKNGYGAHDYTDDADTECNTCGYVRTISGGGGGTHYPAYHGPVQPALVLPPKTGDITFFGWLRALLGVD